MVKKAVLSVVFSMMVVFGANPANAWYVELTGADGTLTAGQTYIMDVFFQSDNATDTLNDLFVNVDYDETKLTYVNTIFNTWYDPATYSTIWTSTGLPVGHDAANGFLDTISGSEDFNNQGQYEPGATQLNAAFNPVDPANQIARILFTAEVDGTYTDLASFASDPNNIFIMQISLYGTEMGDPNMVTFHDADLSIAKMGSSSTLSPVPVPAAVWLLGSGLLGLVGMRRRNR